MTENRRDGDALKIPAKSWAKRALAAVVVLGAALSAHYATFHRRYLRALEDPRFQKCRQAFPCPRECYHSASRCAFDVCTADMICAAPAYDPHCHPSTALCWARSLIGRAGVMPPALDDPQ